MMITTEKTLDKTTNGNVPDSETNILEDKVDAYKEEEVKGEGNAMVAPSLGRWTFSDPEHPRFTAGKRTRPFGAQTCFPAGAPLRRQGATKNLQCGPFRDLQS